MREKMAIQEPRILKLKPPSSELSRKIDQGLHEQRKLNMMSPCAVNSLNPSNHHSQHPPCTPIPHHFSQLLQAHSRSRHYLLHPPFLSRPLLLLPSPHAHIISFSRPSALITSSHFPYLLQYRLVRSPFCPRHPQYLPPDPNFTGISLLFHCSCLGPCFTAIQNLWEDHSLYSSCFCQSAHMLVLPYFFHCRKYNNAKVRFCFIMQLYIQKCNV